ncbi:toll-like receptor 6 [Mya arenaria]|uniref:toll-like receptor 6 n=1 Tax=Mya arenaria TaxID=6604 RepID=UPI0022E323F2|nr:toll-like receptor 6 [Mya arenaria]
MKDNARKGGVASFYCDYNGKELNIALESSVNVIQRDCMMKVVHTVLAVIIPSCIAISSVLVITIIVFRRRRLKRRVLLDVIEKIRKGEFTNDFLTFLCFASDDTELVERDVYPHLNSTFKDIIGVDKESVCKGDLNFRPGFRILDETEKCLEKCSVLVAAVSKTFCQRHWCENELLQAVNSGKPIVPLMLEKVDKKLMPHVINQFFGTLVHASLINDGKETKLVPDWRVLCNAIIELAGLTSTKTTEGQDNWNEMPENNTIHDLEDVQIEMH